MAKVSIIKRWNGPFVWSEHSIYEFYHEDGFEI